MKHLEEYGLTPPYKIGQTVKGKLVLMDSMNNVFAGFSSNQSLEFAQAVAKALTHEWEHRTLENAVSRVLTRSNGLSSK